jgi:hypothetical protein
MKNDDIARYRLFNQQISRSKFTSAAQMVSHFGAMQAQDYAMAKSAIGIRLHSNERTIDSAIDSAEIIRTHILRPTWHFVSVTDIHWMLKLTAPHVKANNASTNKRFELDERIFQQCNALIEKSLSGNKYLTREELMTELNNNGIVTDDIRSVLIMMNAELDGLVCNGVMRGKKFTYALLDERVASKISFTKEEALAELAKKYFTSHGPATLQDFVWWSGLSVSNARSALESIKPGLLSATVDSRIYYFFESDYESKRKKSIHFLPAFDEFIVSYKNRSASLDPSLLKKVVTGYSIFSPTIVIDGIVEGMWKRTIKKDTVTIETMLFKEMDKIRKQAIFKAAGAYGKYLELKTIVH